MKLISLGVLLALTITIGSCSRSPLGPLAGPEPSWTLLATAEEVVDVSGSSSGDVYVLGSSGTLLHYAEAQWTPLITQLLVEDGSLTMPGHLYWGKIWCASPTDVFMIGNAESLVEGVGWVTEGRIYHYDRHEISLLKANISARIDDVWGISKNNMYVVGENGLILHYDGSSWDPLDSGTREDIIAVSGLPTGEIYLALQHSIKCYDGTSWSEFPTGTMAKALLDIWAFAPNDVYAVGSYGSLLHYDGESWSLMTLFGAWTEKVWGTSSDDIYVGGDSRIYHFDGDTWSMTDSITIRGLWGSSSSDVFAVGVDFNSKLGMGIFHFDGTSWSQTAKEYWWGGAVGPIAICGNEEDLWLGSSRYGGVDLSTLTRYDGSSWNGHLVALAISDVWIGPRGAIVAVGNSGGIFFDGAMWRYLSDDHRLAGNAVWGSDSENIFVVGSEGKIVRFDGNAIEDMETYMTVSLYDVWGRSNTEVFAVGDGGIILKCDGQRWRPMKSNTTEDLRAIWGDSESIFAVGAEGTIMRFDNSEWMPMESPTSATLTGVWGTSEKDAYAVGPDRPGGVTLHYDGSDWKILSDTVGGTQVWVRSTVEVYVVDGSRVLRYGPR